MAAKAIFEGLIVDEYDRTVTVSMIGNEACYVVDDDGFKRHIASEEVDRQIWAFMQEQIEGKEDLISEQTAKMMGQEDIFTRAMIQNQLKNIDKQFDALLQTGLPEDGRAYMGMMGFKITINVHGEVLNIQQPGAIDPESE